MALKLAYGSKESTMPAIESGGIPEGSLILTKDTAELFFYSPDKSLIQISRKNQFSSMEEANNWVKTYDCKGQIVSVHEGDVWGAYIVDDENNFNLIAGDSVVQTAATHLEFPTVGVSNVLYLATEEHEGKGYIYRWCESRGCYEIPADTNEELSIEVIDGGSV